MVQFGNFAAWICVDGAKLEEYGVNVDEEKLEVACWVPSEAGKIFAAHWRATTPGTSTNTAVRVDGVLCGKTRLPGRRFNEEASRDSVATSDTTRRPLMFSELRLTDEEDIPEAQGQGIGDIRLDIWECVSVKVGSRRKQGHPSRYSAAKDFMEAQGLKVHERSKKASTHRVCLGQEYHVPPPVDSGHSKTKTKPVRRVVTFIFKYQGIGMLRASGLAPPLLRNPARPNRIVNHNVKREQLGDVIVLDDIDREVDTFSDVEIVEVRRVSSKGNEQSVDLPLPNEVSAVPVKAERA